ncbi:MAG: PAS domain S-box protein, partial [Bacteroidetes bacterium]|nr:PAS domain S-box protein [Bacteroidota bacterium]
KDGKIKTVNWNLALMVDEGGKKIGVTSIGEDITERIKAKKKLRESEERYRDLFENARELIQSVDMNGNFQYVNKAWKDILGYNPKEINTMSLMDIVHPESKPELDRILKKAYKGESELDIDLVLVAKNGSKVIVEGNLNCRMDDDNLPISTRAIFKDVTARKVAVDSYQVASNIAWASHQTVDLSEFYNLVHKQIMAVIDARNFYIATFDREKSTLEFPYYEDEHRRSTKPVARLRSENGITQYMINKGKPITLKEKQIRNLSVKGQITIKGALPKVWIGVPLKYEDEILGAIAIQNYKDEQALDKNDLDLLEHIASMVALVIVRKMAEGKLRKSEGDFRDLIQNSQDLICTHDLKGRILTINPAFKKFLGYKPAEIIGMNLKAVIVPKYKHDFKRYLEEVASKGRSKGIMQIITRRGKHKILQYNNSLRTEDVKEPIVRGMAYDLTELKQAEAKLRTSQQLYKRLFESNPDLYFRTDGRGRLVVTSPSIKEITGYKPNEVLMSTLNVLFKEPGEAARLKKEIKMKSKVESFETLLTKKDGNKIFVSAKCKILLNSKGKFNGIEGDIRDITSRREAEQQLLKAKSLAEDSAVQKNEFLAGMSHELRTPLSGILGSTQLLGKTKLTKQQAELIDTIDQSYKDLITIIDDMLELSTMEARKLELHPEPVHLGSLLNKIKKNFNQEFEKKGLKFRVKTKKNTPKAVVVDEIKLTRILNNLVSNAVKYTERGSIELRLEHVSKRSTSSRLRFEIEDTGIGILPDDQNKLFSKFVRIGSIYNKRNKGVGLGLAISKNLVELMSGQIGVQSTLQKGSIFWFEIDVGEYNKEIPEVIADERMLKDLDANILLVEDNVTNQVIFKGMLESFGSKVQIAGKGRQGLRYIQENKHDLVLMDMHIPDMSGIDILKALKAKKIKDHPPIIVLSANVMGETKIMAKKYGAVDYLTKPVAIEELYNSVIKWKKNSRRVTKETSSKKEHRQIKGSLINAETVRQMQLLLNDAFQDTVQVYLKESQKRIKDAKEFYARNELGEVKRVIHDIKSSSGVIGVNGMEDIARSIEKLIEHGHLEEIEKELDNLNSGISEVEKELQPYFNESTPL